MYEYYKLPRLYGTETITTEEVMDEIDIFQSIFGKVDAFGWWDLEQFQTNSGIQFTFKEFQEGIPIYGLRLKLAATDHQETNG